MEHTTNEWWRGAVMYQIYPRSFLDTNQDGIGDLSGITDRLDYIAELGVDVIWISPFYPSPMKDFGYDISDYTNVDPIFGNVDDFSSLVAKAESLGLKVMIDMVVSHTSDQHQWFRESRSSRDNPKSDWYIWTDPLPDGRPPNNWLSLFGGGAWEWDATRRQFYLHNFLTSQPDLNFHNDDVITAVLNIAKFWLRLGVHGFRMDTVNWYFHDRELRDNPPNTGALVPYVPESSNYNMQEHIYNKSRPETLPFLERFRAVLDEFDAISLGELTSKTALEMTAEYTQKDTRLHMVYTFALLTSEFSADHFREVIQGIEDNMHDGWVCWAFSNHDVVRAVTRWHHDNVPIAQQAKFLMALLLCLRGAICIYQGEELGLPEVSIAYEDIQDPFGLRLWPEYKGRDGCRTPMPWQMSMPNGGFSNHKPWLPIPMTHLEKAVDVQEKDKDSVLNFTKEMLRWRAAHPALTHGSMTVHHNAGPVLALERAHQGRRVLALFNTSDKTQCFDCSAYGDTLNPIALTGFYYSYDNEEISLPGYSVFLAEVVG